MIRLGIDIGGTFTDVVLENGDQQYSIKVLTTYQAPEDAIVEGLLKVCEKASIKPNEIGQVIHGTTLATNALIERRGAKTAFITTKGFRDVIEMRTESRFEQYDLNLQLPDPLLPRNRRYVVEERMDARGQVLVPLLQGTVEQLLDAIQLGGYESIAIGLLHAYMNDTHERMLADALSQRLPGVSLSLSSQVSPQMREYERFNTTIANAYIKPLMQSYLNRLKMQLADVGAACSVFLMHSGGGIMSLADAAEFPVRLVESGPAGGAIFAADIAARHSLEKVLSFDMGGTTAKICLIKNQTPKTARVFEVARTYRFKKGSGMPISIPVIDMVEIGAGGGSLAHVDALNQIRVGPQSAGSEPGPACYARGGDKPAVTDADLLLGRLDPGNFAGGTIPLETEKASAAVENNLSKPLNTSVSESAWGLSEVVDENMTNAARVHAVENGEDLSEYTMIAFGGAAPLHAGRLCEKLGIESCLIPRGAGVGSAIGFLRAPFSFEANKSVFMRLSHFDTTQVTQLFKNLQNEALQFVRSCDDTADIHCEYKVYMRYSGQGWEIAVPLPEKLAHAPDAEHYMALFKTHYAKLFGRVVDGMEVEITVWSVNAFTRTDAPIPVGHLSRPNSVQSSEQRELFDPAVERTVTAHLFDRDSLPDQALVQGPALITETETTVVVPSSRSVVLHKDGALEMRRRSYEYQKASEPNTNPSKKRVGKLTDVALQVMWNRMISVVEEQAQALVRTAFSTSVREAGDLSAGIYCDQGLMLAQAVTGTPGHVNAMADAVAHFIRRIGRENMFTGDVYITNDPWEGTGHKHDITVVSPAFRAEKLIGFFACTAHVTDIGGRGFGADANDVHEEGLYIPIMKFADRGEVDQTLLALIRGNVREPDQLVGDVYALAACNEIGFRRLTDMMHEFELSDLREIADFIFSHSRKATLERINALDQGVATGAMRIDGYSKPIDLCVSLHIERDRIVCDWAGTSGVDKKGINVPLVYTKAYTCYALKCAIAPDIPNNAASLAPFEVIAPVDSIVNASPPAPVALRHVIGHMIPDTVYTALDKLLPGVVPAEGAGSLCNFQVSIKPRTDAPPPEDAVRSEVLTFNSGGSGARPTLDGMNATAFPSGVMTMPVEATEQVGPITILRKELRPDSGGAGTFRGGLGQFMDVGVSEGHEFDISAMFDRVNHPARGRQGGKAGGSTQIARSDGVSMRGKGKQFVPHGVHVKMAFPGGAGYGSPEQRDRDKLKRDIAMGYITAEHALTNYNISQSEIDAILAASKKGDEF